MSKKYPVDNYIPYFELGVADDNPAVKMYSNEPVCPIILAALMVTLLEATMKIVEDSEQIEYEKLFNKAFKKLMKTKHNYDVSLKYVKENQDEDKNE